MRRLFEALLVAVICFAPLPVWASVTETAVLGGGCFWCLEAAFETVEGVSGVLNGYAGGTVPDPHYEAVCTGQTGHAEVVQVRFDPARVSYADLLAFFFEMHDPTTGDRQGPDVGSQYRSIILTRDERQRQIAQQVMRQVQGHLGATRPLTTQLRPLTRFYVAEAYHQNYFYQHPDAPYCQQMIAPKVQHARTLRRGRGWRYQEKTP